MEVKEGSGREGVGGWGGGSFLYFIPASHPYESTIYFSLFSLLLYLSPLCSWASPHSLSIRDPNCYWSYVQLISKKELEAFRHNRGFFKASIKKKKIADCVVKERERW